MSIEYANHLDSESSLAPMSPLGVVSDGVSSPQTNPLRNRSVLLLRFGELLLRAEGFVARHLDLVYGMTRLMRRC